MNKNYTSSQKSVLRFRRWSRKNFASFCSLGRCVCIGHLKNTIANASMSKKQTTEENKTLFTLITDPDEIPDQQPPTEQFILQFITLFPVVSSEAAPNSYIHTNASAHMQQGLLTWCICAFFIDLNTHFYA
ncbi:MAG: hypothetical protein RR346_03075 [Bacteroidales bacterium]